MLYRKNNGAAGTGYSEKSLCHSGVPGIVHAIQYVIRLIGTDHVALGSDFDSTITTTAGVPLITTNLFATGMSKNTIKNYLAPMRTEYYRRISQTGLQLNSLQIQPVTFNFFCKPLPCDVKKFGGLGFISIRRLHGFMNQTFFKGHYLCR